MTEKNPSEQKKPRGFYNLLRKCWLDFSLSLLPLAVVPLCTFTKLSGGSTWSPEIQNKKTIDGWKRTCSKKVLPISWPFIITLHIPLC